MFREKLRQIFESKWRLPIEIVAVACLAYGVNILTKSVETDWSGLILMGVGAAVLGVDAWDHLTKFRA